MNSKAETLRRLYAGYAGLPLLQQVAHGDDGEAKTLVMPAGPLDAPLMIVGEAPGATEVELGRPFAGPAGLLLQELFGACGLPWEMSYRTNVLPWRPSLGNRTPYPFEIGISQGRVQDEIRLVSPVVVIAAGAVAWQGTMGNEPGHFAGHRGKWVRWRHPAFSGSSCDLLAIYHPAALLHAPKSRRQEMREETLAALRSVLEGDRVAT